MIMQVLGQSMVHWEEKFFRNADNPNDIFILLEINSIENGKKFASSDSTREAMKNAGVVGMPEIFFVEEIAETSE
jgi:hypothetical protein